MGGGGVIWITNARILFVIYLELDLDSNPVAMAFFVNILKQSYKKIFQILKGKRENIYIVKYSA